MRSFLPPFLFILLGASPLLGQSMVVQAPFGDYNSQFQAISVDVSGNGFAAGTCASLLKTTDDGETWAPIEPPMDVDFGTVACAPGTNCQTVFLANDDFIFRSTNGGTSWTTTEVESRDPDEFFFLNNDVVLYLNDDDVLYRSTDGGNNWVDVELPNFPQAAWVQRDQSVFTSFNDNGDYALVESTDGGLSWDTLYTHGNFFSDLAWQDAQNGVFYSTDRMTYVTTDGGTTWTLANGDISFNQPQMFALGNDVYHVHAFPNMLSISTDAGQTWVSQGQYNDFGRANDVQYRGNNVFVAGNQSGILKSTDLAMTFTVKNDAVRADINSMSFLNDDIGYALANESTILRTDNGGDTWTAVQPQNFTSSFLTGRQVEVLDNGDVIATWGFNNATFSMDGGVTWEDLLTEEVEDDFSQGIEYFDVLDNGRIIFVSNEAVLYTDDNGMNWTVSPVNLDFSISWVYFLDNQIGYVGGRNDNVHKTTDGGISWTQLTPPFDNPSTHVQGFVAFDENRLLASRGTTAAFSDDGGQTWTIDNTFPTGYNFDIDANGETWTAGFASGNNGSAHRSGDQGENWSEFGFVCHAVRTSTLTPSGNYFFIGGDGGIIARFDTDQVLSSRGPRVRAEHLNAFPNPTYGLLNLDLSEQNTSSPVDIQLYDLNGRMLQRRRILNQPQVELNLSNLANGVYLLRVQGQGWLQTGRIIKN